VQCSQAYSTLHDRQAEARLPDGIVILSTHTSNCSLKVLAVHTLQETKVDESQEIIQSVFFEALQSKMEESPLDLSTRTAVKSFVIIRNMNE
jgi:hypothetical protein